MMAWRHAGMAAGCQYIGYDIIVQINYDILAKHYDIVAKNYEVVVSHYDVGTDIVVQNY
jgi:hypothetical protein